MFPSPENQDSWDFTDLGLFLGAILPCYVLGALPVYLGKALAPDAFASEGVRTLVSQCSIYALMLGTLYALATVRHDQPFWRSLGFTLAFRGAWLCLVAAPFLAIGLAALGALSRAPMIPNPVENLISGRVSLLIAALFATILGPLFEELFFRGFLFAVIQGILGAWPAIALSALCFSLLHGPEYQWAWQHLMVIFVAGAAFGFARYKTGSTAAAVLLHAGYNMTLVVGFLIQRG
jgi:membrane protease YdiL (CAAX protease family)